MYQLPKFWVLPVSYFRRKCLRCVDLLRRCVLPVGVHASEVFGSKPICCVLSISGIAGQNMLLASSLSDSVSVTVIGFIWFVRTKCIVSRWSTAVGKFPLGNQYRTGQNYLAQVEFVWLWSDQTNVGFRFRSPVTAWGCMVGITGSGSDTINLCTFFITFKL